MDAKVLLFVFNKCFYVFGLLSSLMQLVINCHTYWCNIKRNRSLYPAPPAILHFLPLSSYSTKGHEGCGLYSLGDRGRGRGWGAFPSIQYWVCSSKNHTLLSGTSPYSPYMGVPAPLPSTPFPLHPSPRLCSNALSHGSGIFERILSLPK